MNYSIQNINLPFYEITYEMSDVGVVGADRNPSIYQDFGAPSGVVDYLDHVTGEGGYGPISSLGGDPGR